MTEPILPLAPPGSTAAAGAPGAAAPPAGSGGTTAFGSVLARALDNLNARAQESDRLAQAFAAGEDIELHQVMLAMQETQIAFDLATQVRNRIVDAYQEIMRMQI